MSNERIIKDMMAQFLTLANNLAVSISNGSISREEATQLLTEARQAINEELDRIQARANNRQSC